MTTANVNSLILSTITILKATIKDYNIVNDDEGLREAFHEAGRGLLLVEATLQTIEGRCSLAGDDQSTISLLEACHTKAKLSESIFKDVAQAPKSLRFERYKAAVQQQGKGQTVEVLILGMIADVCVLAENSTVKAIIEDQVNGLRNTADKLSKMDPSVPNDRPGNVFNSYGSGNQFNTPGGTQNNNTGSGNQFPGASFFGTVNFGKNF